jgi:transporter family protein
LLQQPKLALLAAFMGGAIGTSGGLFYSKAMAVGDASTVAAVTASYPPITMLLGALFLKEKVDANKLIGMALALLSALFFARAGKAAA